MKAQLIFAAIVASSVATAAAQYPPARPEQKPEQKQEKQAQTVTVTGCLQTASAATQPAEPTQPTRREPGSSEQFVLAQAKVTGGAAGATGTAGTTGTAGSLASADKFRLIGGKPMELKEHLNHRVEITGTLQPRSERGQEKGTGVGDPKKPAGEANLPALRVTGFKHLAESCGPDADR
jgi:hypothetical protein